MYDNKYPYTDFHEMNLDWFLAEFKKVMDDNIAFKADMTEKYETMDATVQEFTNFVTNYFDNLDVQQEINHKLDVMAADGTLDALLLPYFNAYKAEVNAIVEQQNTRIGNIEGDMDTLEGRMDAFSTLAEGSTTGDAELMDIRVEYNGVIAASAGDAVRDQISGIYNEFDPKFYALRDFYNRPYSKNLFNYEAAQKGKRLKGSDGSYVTAASYYISEFIPVSASTQYYFCYFNSSQQSIDLDLYCVQYDSSKSVIAGQSDATMHTVTTDATCAYIRISSTFSPNRLSNAYVIQASSRPANGTFEAFKNFWQYITNDMKASDFVTYRKYMISNADAATLTSLTTNLYDKKWSATGYRVKSDTGAIVPNASYFVSGLIPVEASTQYSFCYFDSLDRTNAYAVYIGEYDADLTPIPITDSRVNTITTDATCKYMIIAGESARINILFMCKGGQPADGSREEFRNGNDVFTDKLNVLDGTRNCVINFIFDDGLANDYLIKNIFTAAGKTCGFALKSTITDGQKTTYLGYQTNGFEILSHSTGDSTPTTEDPLRESKTILEGKGFNIRGWVTPASALGAKYRIWLRKYYDYAYTVYYGEYSDNTTDPSNKASESEYNLQRVSLESTQTLQLLEDAVDNAIASGGFLTFYAHSSHLDQAGYGAFTTQNVTDLIDYIKTKEADGYCKLMNPADCYDEYYTTRHDDLWRLLN